MNSEAGRDGGRVPRAAIVLTGGGARAAYQVGLLRCLADMAPGIRFSIITGASAGAVNAAFLASRFGEFGAAARELSELWLELRVDRVFEAGAWAVARNAIRWGRRLLSGGSRFAPEVEGLLDPSPLRGLLHERLGMGGGRIRGIEESLASGALDGLAITTLDYGSGRTTTWIEGCDLKAWERPDRLSVKTRLCVDHVMASAALPILFPAVRLGTSWHGDGGVRLATPLASAVHMGADRILGVSTRFRPALAEPSSAASHPPPAQILGKLFNAVFLDAIDEDVGRLRTINRLLGACPDGTHGGLRHIDSLIIRPSIDLAALAREYEPALPPAFRYMTRGLGTRQASSPDFLSMLMFQPDYIARLIEVGEADATRRRDEIARLLMG